MKAKKIVALVAAAAMVLSMAACGSTDNSSSDAKDGSAAAETTKTSDSDTLVMATNATFPPYEYVDGEEYKGIDIEIAQAIADAMGKKLEVDDIDFDSIIPAITTGKADMSLAGMTVTDERKENVDFSDSYATGVQVIIVPEDSDITGPDDLANDKMIGVQQGTTGHIYCSDTPKNGGFGEDHVTAYPNGASAIQALQTGKVDAVVIDNEPAKAFVAENPGLKILDTEYVTEDYAIAVKKGNTELLDQINETLAKRMGREGRVGGQIGQSPDHKWEIVGIMKDFVFDDFYTLEPASALFFYDPQRTYILFVRLKPDIDTYEAIGRVQTVLRSFTPYHAFEPTFMTDRFDDLFEDEHLVEKLSALFAMLAIFISCLGLLGLSAFSAEQRTKEIGVRKVLGAKIIDILFLLGKAYMILLLISFVIGIPVSLYAANHYLKDYAYRITLGWDIFAGVALLITLIALLTVSFQSLRAALNNPVKSIKTE